MVSAFLVHGTCMRVHCMGPNIEQVHGVGVFSLIKRAAVKVLEKEKSGSHPVPPIMAGWVTSGEG